MVGGTGAGQQIGQTMGARGITASTTGAGNATVTTTANALVAGTQGDGIRVAVLNGTGTVSLVDGSVVRGGTAGGAVHGAGVIVAGTAGGTGNGAIVAGNNVTASGDHTRDGGCDAGRQRGDHGRQQRQLHGDVGPCDGRAGLGRGVVDDRGRHRQHDRGQRPGRNGSLQRCRPVCG